MFLKRVLKSFVISMKFKIWPIQHSTSKLYKLNATKFYVVACGGHSNYAFLDHLLCPNLEKRLIQLSGLYLIIRFIFNFKGVWLIFWQWRHIYGFLCAP